MKNIFHKIKENYNLIREKQVFHIILIFILSGFLTGICLFFSVAENFTRSMLLTYLTNFWILFLNFLPIFYIAILVYVWFRKTSISFALSGLLAFAITMVNYAKMKIRNDNFLMEDVLLAREVTAINVNYLELLNIFIILAIISMITITVLLYIFVDRNKVKKEKQDIKGICKNLAIKVITTVILIIFGLFAFNKFYVSAKYYAKTEDYSRVLGWEWLEKIKYTSRGTIYSFLHSYTKISTIPPEGYDKEKAKNDIYQYEYSNIPDEKKVNIICVMLESYNDFSKFKSIKFAKDPYEKFHEIKENSYSGELVVNVFGGGTIDTERKFLTGYTQLPNFRKHTNSYVRYLNQQGYTTEGAHPSYEWFYSRNIVNENIGFKNYYFYENRFKNISKNEHALDNEFMPEIINMYKKHSENNDNPYFSFNITYQNHLPYENTKLLEDEYIAKTGDMTDEEYYIVNNYFDGINSTNEELYKLVQEINNIEEPVIFVTFGDHNPSLDDGWNALNIDMELSEENGSNNYYSTPYVIIANKKAKEVLNNDFIGKGRKISPNYLMNEIFDLAGYGGNEFMKLANKLRENLPIINTDFYYENGKFVRELGEDTKKIYEDFQKMQYYWTYDDKVKN